VRPGGRGGDERARRNVHSRGLSGWAAPDTRHQSSRLVRERQGSFHGVTGSFEAVGAAPANASVGISAAPWTSAANRVVSAGRSMVFPAALQAFDPHGSGALEDVTGVSHPGGEPPVFGTPWTVPFSFEASAHGPGPSRPGPVGTGVLTG